MLITRDNFVKLESLLKHKLLDIHHLWIQLDNQSIERNIIFNKLQLYKESMG